MTDLPRDAITIVIAYFDIVDLNLVAVLHKNTTTRISIQILIVGFIAVEHQIPYFDITDIFATYNREESR